MGDYITVVIAAETCNFGSRYFLKAPANYSFNKNDEVITKSGREFRVVFSTSYVDVNGLMYAALEASLGSPTYIVLHKEVKKVKWGDENEDAADTHCDDDSRSGSGDGDETEVHG